MLLLNKTLLRVAKGLWGWIVLITALKLLTLVGTAAFAQIISGFLRDLISPQMTAAAAGQAVLSALLTALLLLGAELLTGEAEYRCTAKARLSLRRAIFSKALDLDVGNMEKIGPVSAITSAVDGVEAMQVYYSKYLPGLLYCLAAPFYLFWRMGRVSPGAAAGDGHRCAPARDRVRRGGGRGDHHPLARRRDSDTENDTPRRIYGSIWSPPYESNLWKGGMGLCWKKPWGSRGTGPR